MSETKTSKVAEFEAIFGHRLTPGAATERGGWLTWETRTSQQTLGKFVDRAKRAGFRSAFSRPGVIGVLASDVE